MTSTVGSLLLALASCMASLNLHVLLHVPSGVASPVSAVELTTKVLAHAGLATITWATVITTYKRTARAFPSATFPNKGGHSKPRPK